MVVHLPIRRELVVLRQPAGVEDMMLAEASGFDLALAAELLKAIVSSVNGGPVNVSTWPVTDLEATLLILRRWLVGDHVKSDVTCSSKQCGARVDVGFRITDYLAHHTPRSADHVEPAEQAPWFKLRGKLLLRIPTVHDALSVGASADRANDLRKRCIDRDDLTEQEMEEVDEALDSLAPSLVSELTGACPECEAEVTVLFDPVSYVLRELSKQANAVFEEVHLLAFSYHWPEREILSLPRRRRARYVEMIHAAGG